MNAFQIPLNKNKQLLSGLALLALAAAPSSVLAQDERQAVSLPAPTGQYDVGIAVWRWVDKERGMTLEAPDGPRREIMAQLWYPADKGDAEATPYRPLSGGMFDFVTQHAVAAASFAEMEEKSELIVLCPGRGTSRHYYSSVAEDLASHGFSVFAIDSPLLGFTPYPDGRVIRADDKYRPSFELITGPYEKVDEFFESAV